MKAEDLRTKFVDFFVGKAHKLLPPASLIPENDPSVLFTTAGMQQFKGYYTNPEQAPAKNIVTVQPCFRTSDIDLVGDDTHLTFFEMLGNFSFGGYFKEKAIKMAYEFLTGVLNIEPKRIKCSIFKGDKLNPRDKESAEILEKMGLGYEEFSRKENFWGPTGDEGPCGPTVEFYVDNVEVWNLVFNEYYKEKDGSYRKLETPGVDTGMGLERMLVVVNGLKDVYETDVFVPIIKKIEEISGKKYQDFPKEIRIIADHIKASAFAINDGIVPSNKDAGYIVRRVIRRMVVKGRKLNIQNNFLPRLVGQVAEICEGGACKINSDTLKRVLDEEETKFRQMLENGIKALKKVYGTAIGIDPENFTQGKISNNLIRVDGKVVFDIYQKYGFPIELSQEIMTGWGLRFDEQTVKEAEEMFRKHQELSRTASAGMFRGGLAGESEVTIRMHTATHLLLKALQEVLGEDIHQRGSNINEERIRFDFSYPKPMTEEEIRKVEEIVNQKIKEDLPVVRKETTIEEAKQLGAEAQFIEKYSQYAEHAKLTMYSINDFSHELCGGPHVKSTSEIGKFKIIKEESSSAGTRRIRAILEY